MLRVVLENISFVAKNFLCTGCGTCVGSCPTHAIYLEIPKLKGIYAPKINEDQCIKCKICINVCPGHTVNLQYKSVFDAEKLTTDCLLGNYFSCYLGHSNDEIVRAESSSGGIATQILIFALENKIIDGAILVRMNEEQPLRPEPFIAITKEEIMEASKSKYCPVPLNSILNQIKKINGKLAIVGLPCHIHGIRLAEKHLPWLKGKIVLRIGLFCSHTVNFNGTEFILQKFGVKRHLVDKLNYRGGGWPGFMSLHLKSGQMLRIDFIRSWKAYWNVFSSFFFTPTRCLMCPDQSNELSDISIGDAWLPQLRDKKMGHAMIISRSRKADDLLKMQVNGNINLIRVTSRQIKESQEFSLNFKKENLHSRLQILELFGRKTPKIIPLLNSKHVSKFSIFLPFFSLFCSSNKYLRKFLNGMPLPLFRLYLGFFMIFSKISKNPVRYK